MSYSCGKDSTLALHKMLAAGHTPLALLVMFNPEAGRSYFPRGGPGAAEGRYGEALELPLPGGADTAARTLPAVHGGGAAPRRRRRGRRLVCFGDIDIVGHRAWGEERCRNVGLEAYYPLWQRGREGELSGRCWPWATGAVIKSLNNTLLPRSLLGRVLDEDVLAEMERCGIDLCGENGEYHTLVVDGPVFHKRVAYQTGKILDFGEYSLCDIFADKRAITYRRPADGCRRGDLRVAPKASQSLRRARRKSSQNYFFRRRIRREKILACPASWVRLQTRKLCAARLVKSNPCSAVEFPRAAWELCAQQGAIPSNASPA